MKCPVCGAENPDDSKYCSKCLTNLTGEQGEYSQAGSVYGEAAGGARGGYGSPSEWRGTSSASRSDITRKYEEKTRRAKVDLIIYGVVTLVFLLAIILSLTIWGNKTPTEVATGFMTALNERDIDAMSEYVMGSENEANIQKMQKMIERVGEDGSFEDLQYSSEEIDYYSAVVELTGGTYNPAGTALIRRIDESSRLYIALKSQKGHWYVDLDKTFVFP